MHLMLHKLSTLLGVQLLELMVACGVDPEQLKQNELDAMAGSQGATDTQLSSGRKIRAVLQSEDGLVGVSASYQLVNCTGTVSTSFKGDRVNLPDSALGCRVAITELIMGEQGFALTDAQPEWKTGETMHFRGIEGALELLEVRIEHQLSSVPTVNEEVKFVVRRSDAAPVTGSRTLLAAGVQGSEAPSFRIRKTEFVGLTSEGAGQFVFHLECLKPMQNVVGKAPTCSGVALNSLRYQLIKDDFNSELSIDQADAIFAENSGHAVDATTDFEAFKSERQQSGGFQTHTGDDVLEGPERIHDSPNMILLLQGPGPSYQYFNVDVIFTSN